MPEQYWRKKGIAFLEDSLTCDWKDTGDLKPEMSRAFGCESSASAAAEPAVQTGSACPALCSLSLCSWHW